jgi:hypothetical protein
MNNAIHLVESHDLSNLYLDKHTWGNAFFIGCTLGQSLFKRPLSGQLSLYPLLSLYVVKLVVYVKWVEKGRSMPV